MLLDKEDNINLKDINKKYDKFYTKKEVAEKCLNILTEYYPNIYKAHYFLEPIL